MSDDFTVDQCRTCNRPVIWAVTRNAKDIPVDTDPVKDGNVQLEAREGMQPLARVLPVAKQFGKTSLRKSHFASCPQADRWRAGRRPARG